jgi:hypothetical protein
MRRAFKTTASALVALAAIGLSFHCGSPTDPPHAGGSGAGNPGGTVALSMLAGKDMPMGKLSIADSQDIDIVAGSKPIIATDHAGLELAMTGISLSNVDIHFTLDTSETPESLLSSMRQRPPELSIDTHSIVLSGPYLFNALEGNVDSSIRVLRLPVARYTGVKLHFNRDSISDEQSHGQLVMNGTFVFNGTVRNIAINLTNTSRPWYQQSFRFTGGIFTLTPTDTTNLQLQFNAKKWFSQVDLACLLDRGSLSIDDSTDTLVISNRSNHSPSEDIGNIIFKDFIASGRLVVF